MVRGGGGGGKSPSLPSGGSTSSSSPPVNIPLKIIPYITQYIKDQYNIRDVRSDYYCGLASALMVRAKYAKNSSYGPAIYNSQSGNNSKAVINDMRTMDSNLGSGGYSSSRKRIDIYTNKGLLYIGSEQDALQYSYSRDITTNIYYGLSYGRADGLLLTTKKYHML
jgi:hypothetical protein